MISTVRLRGYGCLLIFLLMFFLQGISAQVLYGNLVGVVTDVHGYSINNAQITVTETQKNVVYKQHSNAAGKYEFTNLLPGIYQVSIQADGFSSTEQTNIVLQPNATTRVDVNLRVAGQNETVEVKASAIALQTESASVQGAFSKDEISEYPTAGFNNYQSLLSLLPGATPSRYQNSVMDTPSRSLTTNINGGSRNNNVTSVDGAAIQQVYLPHHTLYNPPSEDIESVNIVTNSFMAEQGMAGSAVVTVFTKSGSNRFHASMWERNTNSSLTARNYFYTPTYFATAGDKAPKNILNLFGANLGGPIRHNRLFFFTGFEGLSQRQLYPALVTLPTDAERSGDFTGLATIYDPSTGKSDGTGRATFKSENSDGKNAIEKGISTSALALLKLIPHANLSGTSNNYSVAGTYSLDRLSMDEKVTWIPDSRSSLFTKFSFMAADAMSPSTLGIGGGTGMSPGGSNAGSGFSKTRVIVGGVGYTRMLNDHLVVDGNFGIGHNNVNWYENDYSSNLGPTLGIPGTNSDGNGSYGTDANQAGLPSFAVSGMETFGNTDNYTPELKHDYTFTYVGNLSWKLNNHLLRFGVQSLNNRLNEYQPQRGFGPRGGFTFNGGATILKGGSSATAANAFAQFLLGLPYSMGKSYQYLKPMSALEWQYGLFAQDQWQATRRLTVTAGLRWEYFPIMKRTGRGIERYDMSTNTVILGGISGQPGRAGTTAGLLNFGPRAGLAYRLNNNTVLRAGYGIGYDPYPFSRAMRDPYPVTIAQQVTATSTYLAAGTFTAGIPAYSTVAPTITGGVAAMPTSAYTKMLPSGVFRRGYIESWNVTIERMLPAEFILRASYVGTQTIRQIVYLEVNAGQTPGLGSAGQPLYTAFGRNAETQEICPYGTARYQAFQASLKHPMNHFVMLSASYTLGKSIDEASDDDSTPLFNAAGYQYRNRAISDFDRRQMMNAAFSARIPLGRDGIFLTSSGLLSAIAGNWRINGVVSRVTGLPFTATASSTSLNAPNNTQVANQLKSHVATLGGIGSSATWFDTSAFAAVSTAAFGTASRNGLRGPGSSDLDLGMVRSFALPRGIQLTLRAEAFNVTNTPNFALPATSVSSSSFGHITSTAGSASDQRVIRFSGKLQF